MAVKKKAETKVDVEITTNEAVEEAVKETPVVEIPEVKEEPKTEAKIEVKAVKIDDTKKPEDNFKIRMRVNHRCAIAGEFYDLKENCTYTVSANVKRILTEAGLLAPL